MTRPRVNESKVQSCPPPTTDAFLSRSEDDDMLRSGAVSATRTRCRGRKSIQASSSSALDDLPGSLRRIVGAFQMVPDPMQRYKQLLFFASKLKPLAPEAHVEENRVKGCVSQVWVLPEMRDDGLVYFQADSDSQLTKGLAALLVEGLSGCTPQEVLSVSPDFIEMLGLKQSLTPSRNNGFLNMLKMMQKKTLELLVLQAKGDNNVEEEVPASNTPVRDSMQAKLERELSPVRLSIEDNSDQHSGHGGSKGLRNTETHLAIDIVSEKFSGMNQLKRHRLVYGIVDEEIKAGVHALSITAKTPDEVGM